MHAHLLWLNLCKRMFLWVGILAIVLGGTGASFAAGKPQAMDPRDILGPLPIRSFSPFHLLFFAFTPERAYALPRGRAQIRLDIFESNTLLDSGFNAPSLKADLEMTRVTWRGRYGLTDRITLGFNLPLVYTHGLFLDAFINGFERGVNRQTKSRAGEVRDQVDVHLATNGITAININEGGFGVGDLSIEGLYQLVQESMWVPAVSFRVAVKFPTGDFENLRGSEEFDYAFGLALQKIWGSWSLSGGGGMTLPGNPFKDPVLDPDLIFHAYGTLEWLFASAWSVAVQLSWSEGLMDLKNTGLTIEALTGDVLEVSTAIKWAFARNWLAQFGLVENILETQNTAADFTFYISLGFQVDTK